MAYSGAVQVMEFLTANIAGRLTVANAGIDVSDADADAATMIVPCPLMIYGFGVYVMEDLAASLTGSIFLERATVIAGTDTTVVEFDLDSTDLQSGDGTSPLQTSSTGSEDIDAGDVAWAPSSSFPVLIQSPQVLTVRHVQTAVAGEVAPFILARWQGPDLRQVTQWADAT
jgi:hypothetical protein